MSSARAVPKSGLWRSASKSGQRTTIDLMALPHYRCTVFRSGDQVLSASQCRMVTATKAVKVNHLGPGHMDIFLIASTVGIRGGVKHKRVASGLCRWKDRVRRQSGFQLSQVWILHRQVRFPLDHNGKTPTVPRGASQRW